jgi:hypothetical protein
LEELLVKLVRRPQTPSELLDLLQAGLRSAWERGWRPTELVHVAGRELSRTHITFLRDLMAWERATYPDAHVTDSWDDELRFGGVRRRWDSGDFWSNVQRLSDESWAQWCRISIEVLRFLILLFDLEVLEPVPGQGRRGSLGPAMVSDDADLRMRDKVRALLAKAEATEYPEEAESLTTKAQELMARHSIDYAMLAAKKGDKTAPRAIRILLDNPYEDAKAFLLQKIATANTCAPTWHKGRGMTTVVGYPTDLAAVELLYTSLLVQGSSAMVAVGRDRKTRSVSFRRSFLYAYTVRIGERLAEAVHCVGEAAATESAGALVPVLTAKREAVSEASERMVGQQIMHATNVGDGSGWIAGRTAADLAHLGAPRRPLVAASAGAGSQ